MRGALWHASDLICVAVRSLKCGHLIMLAVSHYTCGCVQLKEDTIALAAGAVTAMLAANAAAAGPMDSPEKVRYMQMAHQLCMLSYVGAFCRHDQPSVPTCCSGVIPLLCKLAVLYLSIIKTACHG